MTLQRVRQYGEGDSGQSTELQDDDEAAAVAARARAKLAELNKRHETTARQSRTRDANNRTYSGGCTC